MKKKYQKINKMSDHKFLFESLQIIYSPSVLASLSLLLSLLLSFIQMAITRQTFQLCILGETGGGKSSFAQQYINGDFVDDYDPTLDGSYSFSWNDFYFQLVDFGCDRMLDTSQLDLCLRRGTGFIFLYSITSLSTFEALKGYISHTFAVKDWWFPLVICGNKKDREEYRQVEREEGEELAKELGGAFFEISAKSESEVRECMEGLMLLVSEQFERERNRGLTTGTGCCSF